MQELADQSETTDLAVIDPPADQPEKKSGWMVRLVLYLVLIAAALAYPVMVLLSHQVSNRIPQTMPNQQVWADPKIGASVELLERELYFGWASSQPLWHPQSRLTAMPAFQAGIGDLISAMSLKRSEPQGMQAPDSDLRIAHSLLGDFQDKDSVDRVRAAIEALKRFDGRKARFLLEDRSDTDLLLRDISVYRGVLGASIIDLRSTAAEASRGVFNREDVRLYFHTKGELHAIGVMLYATEPEDFDIEGFDEAIITARTALDRAALPSPITVSNPQPGSFAIGGNDIMELAYLTMEADRALADLERLLIGAQPVETPVEKDNAA